MKKIVVIGSVPPYKGGLSHFNSSLVNELIKNNEVKVISWKRQYPKIIYPIDPVEKNDEHLINNDETFLLDFYNPFSWFKASKIINDFNPDIVIFTWLSPIVSPIYTTIANFIKVKSKIVCIAHNVSQHEGTFLDNILRKAFFNKVEYFIVHSNKDFEDSLKINSDKKTILSFHPVYDMFKTDLKFNSKYKDKILFFGYIREYKGLIYLIRAMPDIIKKINVRLLIVGEFWENNSFISKLLTKFLTGKSRNNKSFYFHEIKKLNLNNNIEVIDKYVPDNKVGEYFSKSDILVLPYTSATQSGPIQVAYNFNTPVICTDVGGLPELVINNKTGFVVPSKNPKALADVIIRFYKNKKKKEFSVNIKKLKDKYSWKHYCDIIESL